MNQEPLMDNAAAAKVEASRPEDEKFSIADNLTYGIQHVLTMYGGVIAAPLIIGGAAGLSPTDQGLLVTAALFISGLATLLQTLGLPYFGAQLPIVQGISFAAVSTMVAIVHKGGLQSVYGSIIVAGIVGVIAAPYFAKVVKLFPPVVTGCIIAVIGLSLLPTTFQWAMGNDSTAKSYGSMGNIALAGFTLLVILLISRLFQGALSRLSILLGIIIGTVVALPFGINHFGAVGNGPIVALPPILHFGGPHFEISAIISMVIVMFVIMTETTADIMAICEIVGTEHSPRRVGDGLRADMASSTIAALLGSFPCSAFAQNVGLVALTKVKSRFVVAFGGGVLVLLGLLPVVGRAVAAIPFPVLGGAGIVLFGSVTASGIRTLAAADYHDNLNLVLVATAIGIGVIPIVEPTFWSHFPDWFQVIMSSGISAASIVAVGLNLFFNVWKGRTKQGASVLAAGLSPSLIGNENVDVDH